jgi:CheY-like chemotaxis protein
MKQGLETSAPGGSRQMAVTALIVDDSNLSAQVIRYHLRSIGCTVIGEARNASEGLRLFRELKPDIITLDLMMPKIDTIDSMTMLRAVKQESRNTVVVVASVIPFEKTQSDFLDEGVLAYVIKPFNQFSFEPVRRKLIRAFPELSRTGT